MILAACSTAAPCVQLASRESSKQHYMSQTGIKSSISPYLSLAARSIDFFLSSSIRFDHYTSALYVDSPGVQLPIGLLSEGFVA